MFRKVLLIVFASIFAIGVSLYVMAEGLCRTQYASAKIYSPDNEYFAQVQDESCGGAVGDYTTGVIVTNAKSYLSKFDFLGANIINAKSGNTRGVFSAKGKGDSIKISWEDNRTLKVSYQDCGTIYGKDGSWKDIKIIYERQCSENN